MENESVSLRFTWADYLLFGLMLSVSSVIGIYHAWKGAGSSTRNFFLGGKSLGFIPIALSTGASAISATTMLGTPTEVYLTGTMYWWMAIANMIGCAIACFIYLPLYHQLQIVSVNQYLEYRFHPLVRKLASFIYLINVVLLLAILVYDPSLALAQVTGLSVYLSCGITILVCTFYTTLGGMKAVVWTDTVQMFVMFASMITLLTKGMIDVGADNVWERNLNSSRLEFFVIDPNPTTRHTVWSLLIGGGFLATGSFATSQGFVQRFLSMSKPNRARNAMLTGVAIAGAFITLACLVGLVAYAKYYDCDLLQSGVVDKADQIIPYFLMDTLGSLPGLPGLFVAGVFSAALSSLSTFLNAAALLVMEDFIRPFHPKITDVTATRITKGISIAFGCIGFGFVFLVSNVSTILDASLSMNGAGGGTILGVFTLGMFVPWANSIGAGIAMAIAYVALMVLVMSTQIALSNGLIDNPQLKPVSTENCPSTNLTYGSLTITPMVGERSTETENEVFILLEISYLWYTLIGILIVLLIGTLISFLTGPQDPGLLNPKLVCRFIQKRVGHKLEKEESGQETETSESKV